MSDSAASCRAGLFHGARAAQVACSIAVMIDGAYLHAALSETPNATRAVGRVEDYLTLALNAG